VRQLHSIEWAYPQLITGQIKRPGRQTVLCPKMIVFQIILTFVCDNVSTVG
jgi:hypothetical protein